jgi:hypothetical protein
METYSSTVDLERAIENPFYALSPFFRAAISSEMALLHLINTNLNQELDHSNLVDTDGGLRASPTMSNLLYSQQILKRHIQHLKAAISFMKSWASTSDQDVYSPSTPLRAPSPWTENPPPTAQNQHLDPYRGDNGAGTGLTPSTTPTPRYQHPESSADTIQSMISDYQYALAYAEALSVDCVQGMSIMAHHASLYESQKAIAEAKIVTRLTRLATVFVPLTLVTSVFGMNVRELGEEAQPPLWWWAVASVVVGIASWIIITYDVKAVIVGWWKQVRSKNVEGVLKTGY